jgi:hypothetical protein
VRTKLAAVASAVAVLVAGVGAWAIVRDHRDGGPAVRRAVARVRDAHPVLLPTIIPSAWKTETDVSRSFFRARYTSPDGTEWFQIAIAVPNPALSTSGTTNTTIAFRNDRAARYDVHGATRSIRWSEKGSWTAHVGGQSRDSVPYEVTGDGLGEARFLDIARSLEEAA